MVSLMGKCEHVTFFYSTMNSFILKEDENWILYDRFSELAGRHCFLHVKVQLCV